MEGHVFREMIPISEEPMRRASLYAASAAIIFAGGWRAAIPTPCKLLTQQDAVALMGFDVALDSAVRSSGRCAYHRPAGGPFEAPEGVELHVLTMSSPEAAHERYPSFLSATSSVTVTPAPGVGDEANYRRSPQPAIDINAIVFRKGATLFGIGTHPSMSDDALKTAALKVISRM
jgi:hypothetical protein